MTTEIEMNEALAELLLASSSTTAFDLLDASVRNVKSFKEVGMLTKNKGLVVTLTDGSEFQVTVVKSR